MRREGGRNQPITVFEKAFRGRRLPPEGCLELQQIDTLAGRWDSNLPISVLNRPATVGNYAERGRITHWRTFIGVRLFSKIPRCSCSVERRWCLTTGVISVWAAYFAHILGRLILVSCVTVECNHETAADY